MALRTGGRTSGQGKRAAAAPDYTDGIQDLDGSSLRSHATRSLRSRSPSTERQGSQAGETDSRGRFLLPTSTLKEAPLHGAEQNNGAVVLKSAPTMSLATGAAETRVLRETLREHRAAIELAFRHQELQLQRFVQEVFQKNAEEQELNFQRILNDRQLALERHVQQQTQVLEDLTDESRRQGSRLLQEVVKCGQAPIYEKPLSQLEPQDTDKGKHLDENLQLEHIQRHLSGYMERLFEEKLQQQMRLCIEKEMPTLQLEFQNNLAEHLEQKMEQKFMQALVKELNSHRGERSLSKSALAVPNGVTACPPVQPIQIPQTNSDRSEPQAPRRKPVLSRSMSRLSSLSRSGTKDSLDSFYDEEAGGPSLAGPEASGKKKKERVAGKRRSQGKELEETRNDWHQNQEAIIQKQMGRKQRIEDVLLGAAKRRWDPGEPPDSCVLRFVTNSYFTSVCATVILLNTVFMGFETDQATRNALNSVESPEYFRLVNRCFNGYFCIELFLRLVAYRMCFILGPDAKWNIFDCSLVALSVMQEAMSGLNVSFVRILRVFRMIRVMRIVRVLRFFRELRKMTCAIGASFASLSWAFVLLMIITYVFAIVFMQGAYGFLEDGNASVAQQASIKKYYGDLFTTVFTLILAISGGADWGEMALPLADISEIYRAFFTLYIVFVVFGVLNVLTGVFVGAAAEIQDRDLIVQDEMLRRESFTKEMTSLFKQFDTANKGYLDWESFRAGIADEAVQAYLSSHQLDTSDAFALFKLLDRDMSKQIDVMEFILACFRVKGSARSSDMTFLLKETEDIGKHMSDCLEHVEEMLDEIHTKLNNVRADPMLQSSSSSLQTSPREWAA